MNELPETTVVTGGPPDLETLDYWRGVKSSTCLLLPTTPSPTPLDLKHPLSEETAETPFLTLKDDRNLDTMQSTDAAGDSSSSGDSNSVVQDPVSAQLINNISMLDYQTLSKNGDVILGPAEDCKLNGNVNGTNRKLPGFVNWNWPLIRKFLLWVVMAGLVACVSAIIAMVVTIPKSCNPDLPWYQGKVFYEIFPAGFKDTDGDGTGDLKGLIKKFDYIHDLGATAIRLNSIFEAASYPDQYDRITSLMQIDPSIGTLRDFQKLVETIHEKDMHIILDLPVLSMASLVTKQNATRAVWSDNDTSTRYYDETSQAIAFWAHFQNVDGFYLKRLEDFVDDENFIRSLQIWKQIIGFEKVLISSEETYLRTKGDALEVLLSKMDLIDIHLDLNGGIHGLKDRIENIITGTLWEKPHYPWVHWNIGNINSERIATRHMNNTLALTALEFMLPGTVSIFYGDEIGLGDASDDDVEEDFHEHKHIHHLVQMSFANVEVNNNNKILPWNPKSSLEPKYYFLDTVRALTKIRINTPTIYLRAIYKEGNILKNMEIRKTEENLVVIQRWYPRRNTCVFVGNLGNESITTDLSSMFYGGTVVTGTNSSLVGQVIFFDQVTFPPNSAIILKLEK